MKKLSALIIIQLCFSFVACGVAQDLSNEIVLINSNDLTRDKLAEVIMAINNADPGVIAIDLQFYGVTTQSIDVQLMAALDKSKKLVMISEIANYSGLEKKYLSALGTLDIFLLNAKTGFGNFIHEKDNFNTLKRFSTFEVVDDKVEYNFAVRIAMEFDSTRTNNFLKRNSKVMEINYLKDQSVFTIINANYILSDNKIAAKELKDKIVMIGYLGPSHLDKYYTPLNEGTLPFKPDMYGVSCLSNIVYQILHD